MLLWSVGSAPPGSAIGVGVAFRPGEKGCQVSVTAVTQQPDPSVFLRGQLASDIEKDVLAAGYKDSLAEGNYLVATVQKRLSRLREERTRLIRELEPTMAALGEIEALLAFRPQNGLGDSKTELERMARENLHRSRSRIAEEERRAKEMAATEKEEYDRWFAQAVARTQRKQAIEDQIRRLQDEASALDRPPAHVG